MINIANSQNLKTKDENLKSKNKKTKERKRHIRKCNDGIQQYINAK
jgi:hypothetical protein